MTSAEQSVLALTPLAVPARAVTDAAIMAATPDQVRALVARAVQRRACSPAELGAELQHCPRNGSAHLRRALSEIGAGVRSVAEASAFGQLRRSRVPAFELNVPVVDASGKVVYVLDALWRDLRAALEIDGREYHFAWSDWQSTLRRHNALVGAALSVVHYPPSRIMRGGGEWLLEVEQWLRTRASELGVAYVPGSPRRRVAPHDPEPLVLSALAQRPLRPTLSA